MASTHMDSVWRHCLQSLQQKTLTEETFPQYYFKKVAEILENKKPELLVQQLSPQQYYQRKVEEIQKKYTVYYQRCLEFLRKLQQKDPTNEKYHLLVTKTENYLNQIQTLNPNERNITATLLEELKNLEKRVDEFLKQMKRSQNTTTSTTAPTTTSTTAPKFATTTIQNSTSSVPTQRNPQMQQLAIEQIHQQILPQQKPQPQPQPQQQQQQQMQQYYLQQQAQQSQQQQQFFQIQQLQQLQQLQQQQQQHLQQSNQIINQQSMQQYFQKEPKEEPKIITIDDSIITTKKVSNSPKRASPPIQISPIDLENPEITKVEPTEALPVIQRDTKILIVENLTKLDNEKNVELYKRLDILNERFKPFTKDFEDFKNEKKRKEFDCYPNLIKKKMKIEKNYVIDKSREIEDLKLIEHVDKNNETYYEYPLSLKNRKLFIYFDKNISKSFQIKEWIKDTNELKNLYFSAELNLKDILELYESRVLFFNEIHKQIQFIDNFDNLNPSIEAYSDIPQNEIKISINLQTYINFPTLNINIRNHHLTVNFDEQAFDLMNFDFLNAKNQFQKIKLTKNVSFVINSWLDCVQKSTTK